jgi:hypothetical protein
MFTRKTKKTGVLVLCSALLICGGLSSAAFGGSACATKGKTDAKRARRCGICDILFPRKDKPCGETAEKAPAESPCSHQAEATSELPPKAQLGECYSKVMVPAEYKTVTERLMTQEESERIEIVPAEYKWVEERVLVKEASKRMEIVPAEYKWDEKKIMVKPAHTGWVMQNVANCDLPNKNPVGGGVYCFRTTPAEYKTIRTQRLVKPASVREVTIPAEYETVRRQVVATPALARRICIPAEYENIQKTVLVCPESMKWERIVCEDKLSSDTVNKVKIALRASGYKPGPLNGEFTQTDRAAMIAFQQERGLGVGQLSYDTLKKLGISAK